MRQATRRGLQLEQEKRAGKEGGTTTLAQRRMGGRQAGMFPCCVDGKNRSNPCPPPPSALTLCSPIIPTQATLCARRRCMQAIVAQLVSDSEELHQVRLVQKGGKTWPLQIMERSWTSIRGGRGSSQASNIAVGFYRALK